MIKITTLGIEAFEADGVPYTRIFQPIKVGESSVAIIGIYDSSQMILGATTFDEIQVDGVIYVSQKDLMLALINVVSPFPEGVESGVYSVNGKIGAVVLTAPEVGAISEAPQDGKTYVRSNGGWVELDAKKQVFIDLWNAATNKDSATYNIISENTGKYNADTGFFELSNQLELTYEQAVKIYSRTNNIQAESLGQGIYNVPINMPSPRTVISGIRDVITQVYIRYTQLKTLLLNNTSTTYFNLQYNTFLEHIVGNRAYTNSVDFSTCTYVNLRTLPALRSFYMHNLRISVSIEDSPNFEEASILYAIKNASPTSNITITLHADAYTRAMQNAEILTALADNPLITLASI